MRSLLLVLLSCWCLTLPQRSVARAADLQKTLRMAQSKVVKVYGAGGLRQLEAYQSGILISPVGHVLTARSYVLDTDDLAVILDDGRKWQAELLGSDPLTDLALLKLPVESEQLPYFDLSSKASLVPGELGQRIFALSNLYGIATGDEHVSVLHGVITAIVPLQARRGAYQANYRDQVYVLDAYANNPGAAGGALIDWQGRLLGVLGKELRSEVTGTWLNYALPAPGIVATVDDLLAGRIDRSQTQPPLPDQPHSTEALGIYLIPDVLPRTPPYVDSIRRNSPAALAGLRPDDLVVFVRGEPVDSRRSVIEQIEQQDRLDPIQISVLRDGALLEFRLAVEDVSATSRAANADLPALDPASQASRAPTPDPGSPAEVNEAP